MLVTILLFQSIVSMSLCSLAAKKLIQILQERGDDPNNKNEIIELGCQYGKDSNSEILMFTTP
jgi:hypothetical protein